MTDDAPACPLRSATHLEWRRIASHKRLIGKRGQYSILEEHMPKNHQLYSQWVGNRFRRWSTKFGNSVRTVIERLLASYRVEEHSYKGCLSLLKPAGKKCLSLTALSHLIEVEIFTL